MVAPVVIEPEAIYDDGALRQVMGLTAAALARGRRSGELKYTRKGSRILYLGRWVHAWLAREEAACAS